MSILERETLNNDNSGKEISEKTSLIRNNLKLSKKQHLANGNSEKEQPNETKKI